jgi:SAM-dependent methyltransferase
MPDWFKKIILPGRLIFKDGVWVSVGLSKKSDAWSFTKEWSEHKATEQQKTWDMTATERLVHFFSETKTNKEQLKGQTILDAGCGNGQLTQAIAKAGANTVGIDRHTGLPPGQENLQFVQADLDSPPFVPHCFDIIIANGSIHHTRNTFHSFRSLVGLVKENGKLYVWIYKKQSGIKYFLLQCLDILRFFISRFPGWLQRRSVNLLTGFFYFLSRIRKGENSQRTKEELRINIYDAFTPRYRHSHTIEEAREWFLQCGFKDNSITHDNNKYGFGMLGIKDAGGRR